MFGPGKSGISYGGLDTIAALQGHSRQITHNLLENLDGYYNPPLTVLNQKTRHKRYLRKLDHLSVDVNKVQLDALVEAAVDSLTDGEGLILAYNHEDEGLIFVYAYDGNPRMLQYAHERAVADNLNLSRLFALTNHGRAKLVTISKNTRWSSGLRSFLGYCEPKDRLLYARANNGYLPEE